MTVAAPVVVKWAGRHAEEVDMVLTMTIETKGAPSNEELIAQHRVAAEALLRRAERSGEDEVASRWATMATGHAILALTYMTRPVELDVDVPPPDIGPDWEV